MNESVTGYVSAYALEDAQRVLASVRTEIRNRLFARIATGYVNVPPKPRYMPLPISCDLCDAALAWCLSAGLLPRAAVYTLHVHPTQLWVATQQQHAWNGQQPNPFAPQVTVIEDASLNRFEWFLETEGFAIGSDGP